MSLESTSTPSTANHLIDGKYGFVILCPELNTGGLRSTIGAIKNDFHGAPFVIVVPGSIDKEDFKEISRHGPTVCGRNSITSLINVGIHESVREWSFMVMAGALPYFGAMRKYSHFLKDEKDIIYAVADKSSWRFEDSTINGLFVSKKAIKDIGDFMEEESNLEICKLFWGITANELGYKIKGLVGAKIC